MDSTQIVYLVKFIKSGETIYDKDGTCLGKFSGYNTRPGCNSPGSIEIIKSDNTNQWINGRAVYIPCMGLKFVEDYNIC